MTDSNLALYLAVSHYINWDDNSVQNKSAQLTGHLTNDTDKAAACFHFVRDEIAHSWDFQRSPTTCRASDVLASATGYCYAKSHLLAALLRAADIPAGVCYQRLTVTNDQPPFCLHGLNAVYLRDYGWYRVDARGNKKGVNAEFSPPTERLAFPIVSSGEVDLPEIWAEPLPVITECLERHKTWRSVADNLPDIAIIPSNGET
ncbi:transglutaminase family protein [Gilvimarinus sp. SDUM040013]|uniref:Transglutaminase family protein n=1 Tax=Gilvimarinus gilvus TaxID=3058038 RepID=A0ABU4S443_9GAMM|nr:transglutaminase family protein [Gilvimarinus sp. SDUM040013]MDO3385483.1 transglutaminase family protein [Gilvimarinus sp. SDUM040013]MDX6851282.1 transglutaminase family protein [Gilvimarinus sp. SDUM040013]